MSSLNTPPIIAGVTSLAISKWLTFVAAVLLLAPFTAEAISATALADTARVEWQWGVKIPLRDGVHLNATLYKPAGLKEPRPCLFTLTPYVSDSNHNRGMYFAAQGFPFLTVDVRGRGNSEGSFRPLIQEVKDGYDVVEWLAKQPYCNGKISMWGGSYAGYDQWANWTPIEVDASCDSNSADPTRAHQNNIPSLCLLASARNTRSASFIFSPVQWWRACRRTASRASRL